MAWIDDLDPELKEHATNKGWAAKPAEEALVEALKAHKGAEKLIGAPSDQVLRLPKDASDPGFNDAYSRVSVIGRPKEPDGYAFDGVSEDKAFMKWMGEAAHRAGLPAPVAKAMAQDFVKYEAEKGGEAVRAQEAKVGAEAAFLRQNWGSNYDLNTFIASKGAEALGLDKEFVDSLQKQVGFSKVMEGLRLVGSRISEPELLRGGGSVSNDRLSRDEAITRKANLMQDRAWGQKFVNGDADAVSEMTNLNKIIVGPGPTR